MNHSPGKNQFVLWLPGWFPSRQHPLNGDFICRHAEATAQFFPIVVLNIVKDSKVAKIEKEIVTDGNLRIINIYYPLISRINWLEKVGSFIVYLWLCFKETATIRSADGSPQLIHVHIFQKSAIAGFLLSKRWGIPMVYSEHHSKFLAASEHNYHQSSFIKKWGIRFLLQQPVAITAVSQTLKDGLSHFVSSEKIKVIPNVVNTNIFKSIPLQQSADQFRLLHISTLSKNKNCRLIIDAWEILQKRFPDQFSLTIIGPKNNHLTHETVIFKDEMPQYELSAEMNTADTLILFSSYETFGCVAIEAMACGKPILLSDLPIAHELIEDGKHGILAEPLDASALAQKIIEMRDTYHLYDPKMISAYASNKFGYQTVGKMFLDLYQQVFTP